VPVASVRGIELYYEIAGDGPRLLVLAGSGGDLRVTNPAAPLADRFTTLTFDHRGLGQSARPPGPYSMADYAEDAAALLDAVGWEQCHVLGISFGGMVAQELAIRHPGRIDRLVLACSSSGGEGGASAPLHEYAALPPDEQVAVRLEVLDRRHDRAWQAAHPDAVAAMRDRLERAAEADPAVQRGARLQLQARAEHDTYDRLHLITAPTLIAAGLHDGQAPPDNQHALLARIPHAEIAWFEGGHGFLRDDPGAYDSVAAFLLGGA
jgi:3-oxoadipate enol-lactonase